MRNRKAILLLTCAIALLVAAEVLLDVSGRKVSLASRAVLAADAAASAAVALERRGEPAVELAKDGSWRLVRPFAADAEEPAVLRLLDALAQAPVEESITDAELLRLGRTRADYALDEPMLRVSLSNAASRVSVSFGLLTPSGEGVYAAVAGERTVLIVPSAVLAAVDVPVDRLRRRRLFRHGAGDVLSFDVRQGPGAILSFARAGEGWRVGADKASTPAVSKFLSDLTAAEAAGFVWPTGATNEGSQASAPLLAGYGLDPETAVTVTLKRPGGRTSAVSFGKPAGEATVYAFVHGGGAVVTVPVALRDAALQDVSRFADTRLFRSAPARIAALALSGGGSALSASRDGAGTWRLDAPISAPADAGEVEALLARVLSLTAADLDPQGVSVSLGGDAKPVTVARAALFPDGGGFERLRAKELVDLPAPEVRRLVSRTGPDGSNAVSVVFARDRRAWNVESAPEGAAVSAAGVARVLGVLAPLRAVRVERLKASADDLARYGLDRPALSLSVDVAREGAVRRNVLVGAATDGGFFATVGAADAVFVLSPETVGALSSPLVECRSQK